MTASSRRKKNQAEENQRRYNMLRIFGKRYAHMLARHDGRSTHRSGSQGKGIMSQEAFIDWCKRPENMADFLTIYFEWVQSGFSRWFSPSIDRIDSTKGYVAGNLKWLSYAENSEKNNKDPIMVHGVVVG